MSGWSVRWRKSGHEVDPLFVPFYGNEAQARAWFPHLCAGLARFVNAWAELVRDEEVIERWDAHTLQEVPGAD